MLRKSIFLPLLISPFVIYTMYWMYKKISNVVKKKEERRDFQELNNHNHVFENVVGFQNLPPEDEESDEEFDEEAYRNFHEEARKNLFKNIVWYIKEADHDDVHIFPEQKHGASFESLCESKLGMTVQQILEMYDI